MIKIGSSQKLIIGTSAVLAFVLFHTRFEQLISVGLVKPLLSYVNPTITNDIVISIIVLAIAAWTFVKLNRGFIPEFHHVLLTIAPSVVYSCYRLFDSPWQFIGFYSMPVIKYLDVIYILAFAGIVLFLNALRRRKGREGTSQLIEDNPVENIQDDLLNYQEYCKQIADKINHSIFNNAFAIGIIGAWGTGKTSMMNLIRLNLSGKNQIIFQYNPWSSSSQTNVTLDFFNALSGHLSKFHSGVSNILSRYTENLITELPTWRILKIFHKSETLSEQFEKINNVLKQIDKQVIVMMDDLDRLDENELQEVIKLIRNTANFYNTVFIVAYDRNYLVAATKRINQYNAEFFLEKIFQLELTLPHFERNVIRQQIIDHLHNGLGEDLFKEIKDVANETYLGERHSVISEFIVTLRDVSRFCNSLLLNFLPVKDETVFSDFFHLELLRYKFPAVYQLLYQKFDQFLETAEESGSRFVIRLKADGQKLVIETFVEQNSESLSVPQTQVSKIVRLLNKIFPSNYVPSKGNAHLSIRYSRSFGKYFAIRLLKGDLSESEFQKYRGLSQEPFNDYITRTVKLGLGWELRERFETIKSFDNREDFEKIINGIFHLAVQPRAGSFGFSEYMEYDGKDLCSKCFNEDNKLATGYYNGSTDDLKEFLHQNFRKAKYPFHVESEMVRDILSNPVIEYFPLSIAELEAINLDYLKQFLASEHKFTNQIWWLYKSCEYKQWVKVGSNELHSRLHIIPEAKKLVIDFVKEKDLKGFLDTLFDYDMWDRKKISIRPMVAELFDSWDGFYDFLNQFDEQSLAYLREFKTFAIKFKETGYQQRIEFQFEHFQGQSQAQ